MTYDVMRRAMEMQKAAEERKRAKEAGEETVELKPQESFCKLCNNAAHALVEVDGQMCFLCRACFYSLGGDVPVEDPLKIVPVAGETRNDSAQQWNPYQWQDQGLSVKAVIDRTTFEGWCLLAMVTLKQDYHCFNFTNIQWVPQQPNVMVASVEKYGIKKEFGINIRECGSQFDADTILANRVVDSVWEIFKEHNQLNKKAD